MSSIPSLQILLGYTELTNLDNFIASEIILLLNVKYM